MERTWHQSAIAEEEREHAEFLRRCALEAAAFEAPTVQPTPIRSGITQAQLDKQIGDLLKGMGEIIGREFRALRLRVEQLEAREWVGIWTSGKSYAKNSIVSHDGSGWLATRDSPEGKPPGNGWRLVIKRGRDGKDAI